VFDAPQQRGPYEQRIEYLRKVIQNTPAHVVMVGVKKCKGKDHLLESLAQVEAEGGEGLMIRRPGTSAFFIFTEET
jgi:DNA ligase 1